MPDTEDDKLRHELHAQATTTAAERIGAIAVERALPLHKLREDQLVLAFNDALEAACEDEQSGLHVRREYGSPPPGFPKHRRFDAALLSGDSASPVAVLDYKWLGDAHSSPWDAAACVLDLFCLGATVEAGLASSAYFVLGAPRKGKRGGLAKLIEALGFPFTAFLTREEFESFAEDWWLRWHRGGDSGYESATPPPVPEELELRPKIFRYVPDASDERAWLLCCVRVAASAPHVVEARARYRAQIEKKQQIEARLLVNIKARQPDIEALLGAFERAEEDAVYRFYHQSFKVFGQQQMVRRARELLGDLVPDGRKLKAGFERICHEALDHEFVMSRTNSNWLAETRPILEAFWHCKYFLAQLNRYGRELDQPVNLLPEGWAAVLELYGLR